MGERPTRRTFMDMQRFLANLIDIEELLESNSQLVEYLDNPIFNKKAKKEILKLTLLRAIGKVSNKTSNFLMFLVDRDRINLLGSIIKQYLALLYESADIKIYELYTSYRWTPFQRECLREQLIKCTGSRYVILNSGLDPSVVAGFSLKNKSTVLNLTVNNILDQIANYLDIQWQFKSLVFVDNPLRTAYKSEEIVEQEEDLIKWQEEDLLRSQEEDLLRSQEEDLLRSQEEDLLRLQEDNLLRLQEEDLLRSQEEDFLRSLDEL